MLRKILRCAREMRRFPNRCYYIGRSTRAISQAPLGAEKPAGWRRVSAWEFYVLGRPFGRAQ